ncbi:unnamed protein product [Brassica oleracea]
MANQPSVRIAFFAKRHIPLLTELRDDYGMSYDTGEVDEDGSMFFRFSGFYKNFRWNYEPELVGEDCWDEVSEVYKLRSEILVSARAMGNISHRFMNHSCSANAMWQPVEFEKDGQPSVRIAFFA